MTVGVFDGVHLGHQQLFKRVINVARRLKATPAIFTFRNHPRDVLHPDQKTLLITPLEDREALIKSFGIDMVIDVEFTHDFSLLSAREFLEILLARLKMKALVAGPDFALGHNREGDIPTLRRLSQKMGFQLEVMDEAIVNGQPVRSSIIRQLVSEGKVQEAALLLGRPFLLRGRVMRGDGRGKALGFPTANLQFPENYLVPGNGIYATWAIVEGRRNPSATSVGVRPTFGPGQRQVETFIMDFSGELYSKELGIEFVHYLREERAFPDIQALIQQMEKDVRQARVILSEKARVTTGS